MDQHTDRAKSITSIAYMIGKKCSKRGQNVIRVHKHLVQYNNHCFHDHKVYHAMLPIWASTTLPHFLLITP